MRSARDVGPKDSEARFKAIATVALVVAGLWASIAQGQGGVMGAIGGAFNGAAQSIQADREFRQREQQIALMATQLRAQWVTVGPPGADAQSAVDYVNATEWRGGYLAWARISYSADRTFTTGGGRQIIANRVAEQTWILCKRHQIGGLRQVAYNQAGDVTFSLTIPQEVAAAEVPLPGSWDETILAAFCESHVSSTGTPSTGDASGPRWAVISPASSNPTISADFGTLQRREDGTVALWARLDYGATQTVADTIKFDYSLSKVLVSCATRRIALASISLYRGDGVVAYASGELQPPTWMDAVPESIAEAEVQGICKRSNEADMSTAPRPGSTSPIPGH